MKKILIYTLTILLGITAWGQNLSPKDFGLDTATTGESRYHILYNTHMAAFNAGVNVSYEEIDTINLVIPADAQSIPLTEKNNFNGVVFNVLNNNKHTTLFSMKQKNEQIEIEKDLIDKGDFNRIEELRNGTYLLVLSDKTPWVDDRIGYNYPAMRYDILLIKDGKSLNKPVAPYNTPATELKCYYTPISSVEKRIENFTLNRDIKSTFKTYCISLSYQNNVTLKDITINTPKNKMMADAAINVNHCTNINMEDITINGTYSGKGKYGYGLSTNNVWKSSYTRVKATGIWGVWGSNNMNDVTLNECDVNRFDIHCYGRDVICKNTTFRDKQTQFSSFYGNLTFDNCHFIDCIPVRIRSSFNAYTPFDILFKDCTFDATNRHKSLVNVMLLDTNLNKRPELSEKCWPNVTIENLTINAPKHIKKIYLYDPTGETSECKKSVGYLSNVNLKNIKAQYKNEPTDITLYLSSHDIKTKKDFNISLENINLKHVINNINKE